MDLRELAPRMARRFIETIPKALASEEARGGEDWHEPSFFPGWLRSFHELQAMIESVDRGEPLEALNPYAMNPAMPWPARARISGPGWPEWLRAAAPDDLRPLSEDIETVDWAYTPLTDDDLAQVAKLPKASRLFLHSTAVTKAGLPHLEAVTRIQLLWTMETGISEEALGPLREQFPDADIRGDRWVSE